MDFKPPLSESGSGAEAIGVASVVAKLVGPLADVLPVPGLLVEVAFPPFDAVVGVLSLESLEDLLVLHRDFD